MSLRLAEIVWFMKTIGLEMPIDMGQFSEVRWSVCLTAEVLNAIASEALSA